MRVALRQQQDTSDQDSRYKFRSRSRSRDRNITGSCSPNAPHGILSATAPCTCPCRCPCPCPCPAIRPRRLASLQRTSGLSPTIRPCPHHRHRRRRQVANVQSCRSRAVAVVQHPRSMRGAMNGTSTRSHPGTWERYAVRKSTAGHSNPCRSCVPCARARGSSVIVLLLQNARQRPVTAQRSGAEIIRYDSSLAVCSLLTGSDTTAAVIPLAAAAIQLRDGGSAPTTARRLATVPVPVPVPVPSHASSHRRLSVDRAGDGRPARVVPRVSIPPSGRTSMQLELPP